MAQRKNRPDRITNVFVIGRYPFCQPTLRGLPACFPKGGHYHGQARTTGSGQGEVLAAGAAAVAAERLDGGTSVTRRDSVSRSSMLGGARLAGTIKSGR